MNKTNIRYLITLSLIVLLLFSLRYWALGPSNPSMIKTNTIEEFKQKDKCGLCDGVCLRDLKHCKTEVPKLTPSTDCNTLIQKQQFTLKLKNTNYYLGFSSPDSESTVFINRIRKRDNAQKWELIGVFDSKSSGCEYFIRSVSNPDDETVPNYYLSADKDHNLFVSTYGMGSNQKWQIDTTNGTIMTTKYKRYLGAITAKGSRKVYLQCKPLPKESNWELEFDSSPETVTTATEVKESFDNIVSILSNKNPGLRDTRWNGLWIYNNTTPQDMYMINLDSTQQQTQESSDEKELNEKNFLKLELLNGKGTITTYERDQNGVLSQSPSLWDAELVLGNASDGTDDVLYANQRDGTDKLVGYTVNTDSIKDSKDPNASYIKLVRYNKDGKDISSLCVNPYSKNSDSTTASANIDSLCKKVSSDRIISSRDFNEIMGIKRTDYKKLINLPNVTKEIISKKISDVKTNDTQPEKDCRIRYGDRVVIAKSSENNKTDNCGWYGCRVAKLENDKPYKMLLQHGNEAPNGFYFRSPVGGNKKDGDIINYGDKVVIAQSSKNENTSNCGWYGCRVASMEGKTASDSYMKFGHGNDKPQSFYIRPPINDTKRDGQPVNYDDNIIISKSSENSKTDNCGWYGCRVASVEGTKEKDSYMSFKHGGDNPTQFYLRKMVGRKCR